MLPIVGDGIAAGTEVAWWKKNTLTPISTATSERRMATAWFSVLTIPRFTSIRIIVGTSGAPKIARDRILNFDSSKLNVSALIVVGLFSIDISTLLHFVDNIHNENNH